MLLVAFALAQVIEAHSPIAVRNFGPAFTCCEQLFLRRAKLSLVHMARRIALVRPPLQGPGAGWPAVWARGFPVKDARNGPAEAQKWDGWGDSKVFQGRL